MHRCRVECKRVQWDLADLPFLLGDAMSAAARIDYTYRYAFPSELLRDGSAWGLRLATFGGRSEKPAEVPFFFSGQLRQPETAAAMLLTLAKVVTTRFYMPRAMLLAKLLLADPVITSSEELLRLEGFSACCGVYARVDLDAEGFDQDIQGRGTTNVDFNAPMRAALAQIRESDQVKLAVGAKEVQLTGKTGTVVEKKVALPVRWIKGFTEVQAYQPTLELRFELPGSEARRFIRSLPRGAGPKQPSWVTALGRGLRLSQREAPGAVRVAGTERLLLLEPLLNNSKQMRVWANSGAGVSAWEIQYETGRFLLMISPDIWRGFSGEGQVLQQLASKDWQDALPRVQAALRWQARINAQEVAGQAGLTLPEVEAALAVLAARGLVGYDLSRRAYFHRELPFDMELVESLQPRLNDARRLLAENKVRVVQPPKAEGDRAEVMVQGTDVEHRVVLSPEGDKCTCPWYSKHRGERGPCKHVLAARLAVEPEEA
jgi:hypothetical protein